MEKAKDKVIAELQYDGRPVKIYWQDLWFISTIRELGYANLSDIEIQDGRIVMVKRCKEKLKPRRINNADA